MYVCSRLYCNVTQRGPPNQKCTSKYLASNPTYPLRCSAVKSIGISISRWISAVTPINGLVYSKIIGCLTHSKVSSTVYETTIASLWFSLQNPTHLKLCVLTWRACGCTLLFRWIIGGLVAHGTVYLSGWGIQSSWKLYTHACLK